MVFSFWEPKPFQETEGAFGFIDFGFLKSDNKWFIFIFDYKTAKQSEYEAKLLVTADDNTTQVVIIYCKNGDSCKFQQIFKIESSNLDNTLICKN